MSHGKGADASLLQARRVLVVEDDPDMAERLQRLFELQTACQVDMAGCYVDGLRRLRDLGQGYDLVVVDVRLPMSHRNLERNREGFREWLELSEELVKLAPAGDGPETPQVSAIRLRLTAIEADVNGRIFEDAGVRMAEKWVVCEKRTRQDTAWEPRGAFLYLTSRRGDRDDILCRAKSCATRTDFLTKPVSPRDLLQAAIRLLGA